ncbi:T6SS phospholipase effector Tle1-like catalytic domain-containing protein [Pedobacter cryoconitis]|uniref:Putative alpha/beta hydrolase family protein DUF2235 n=1 Tax=Pedobacter cryoconitis TaxID=188932 RepID=A0A327SAT3_9SPHI|nr:DUF2235 domain-containing protein [Pedobacter cryoconitis]RAJ26041.1 putative alpha/beta hydrolase family protein DUF2235 [Pedobacter cryoconitis]
MIQKGNIIKISGGTLSESASQDYTAFANNIHTNAANKILENSKEGIVYGEPKKSTILDDRVNITVGMFFDGTGNNRKNIDSASNSKSDNYYKSVGWKFKWQDNTSYKNDRTNVDNLEKMYKQETFDFSIYIEGIGTENDEYDDLTDMGFATGDKGVRGKVRVGCKSLVEAIQAKTQKNIGTLTFDVFGFSRGAAAARNFVHEVTKSAYQAHRSGDTKNPGLLDADQKSVSKKDLPARGHFGLLMEKAGLKVNFVNIRFAGLFDTVSAFGLVHSNDVTELNLNAINKASKIVHLTAADEHRRLFELTSVTKGIELSLPGVHSDIGGSYVDNEVEKVSLAEEMLSLINREKLINAEKNRLISQGWYRAEQMTNTQPYKLVGTRTLRNKYSLIPLHLMYEMGLSTCGFVQKLINNNTYKIPAIPLKDTKWTLIDVYKRLQAYAGNTAPSMVFNDSNQLKSIKRMVDNGFYPADKYAATERDAKILYELRNKFLHFSSSWDGVGKEPNINKKGERERDVFNKRST